MHVHSCVMFYIILCLYYTHTHAYQIGLQGMVQLVKPCLSLTREAKNLDVSEVSIWHFNAQRISRTAGFQPTLETEKVEVGTNMGQKMLQQERGQADQKRSFFLPYLLILAATRRYSLYLNRVFLFKDSDKKKKKKSPKGAPRGQ